MVAAEARYRKVVNGTRKARVSVARLDNGGVSMSLTSSKDMKCHILESDQDVCTVRTKEERVAQPITFFKLCTLNKILEPVEADVLEF